MEHYNKKADEKRKRALADLDASAYFNACTTGGFQPENLDLYNEGAKLAEAALEELRNLEKAEMFNSYKSLLEETKKLRLNPNNIFEHLPEKGNLLQRLFGYTRLKGDKRSIKTLITRNDPRLGRAFRNDHETASNALKNL